MATVSKIVTLLIVTGAVGLMLATPAYGQRWGRRTWTRRPVRTMPSPRPSTTTRSNWRFYGSYGSLQADYPRYTGAFHERYFNEMRYPTGDRPVRGTAW